MVIEADAQVVIDGHRGKVAPTLRHVGDAGLQDLLTGPPGNVGSVEPDRTTPRREHAEERLQERRLACTIGADDRADAVRLERDAHAAEHVDLTVARDEVAYLEHPDQPLLTGSARRAWARAPYASTAALTKASNFGSITGTWTAMVDSAVCGSFIPEAVAMHTTVLPFGNWPARPSC